MKKNYQDVVSELSRLYSDHDTTNFSVLDFVYVFGSPLEAAAYARLFWPDFVQIDEMVLRSDVIEDERDAQRVRRAFGRWIGDLRETERSFNRLVIPDDVFGKRIGESSDAIDEQLAETLAEMWKARLSQLFSDREFLVTLDRESDGELSVTFCQS